MSKYHAIRTTVEGITFDSKAEAHRYEQLRMCERGGLISQLERQTKFVLIPKSEHGREICYRDDFTYYDIEKKQWVYEDVKGFKTPVYKLKKRMLAEKGIMITEVRNGREGKKPKGRK